MVKLPLDIAEEVGVTKDFISKLNRKVRQPTPVTALNIIQVMKRRGVQVHPRDLFFPETLGVYKKLFSKCSATEP